MKLLKVYKVFAMLLLWSGPIFCQNIFDEDHSKKFANFLFQTAQYDLASVEYERILFYNDEEATKSQLLASYRLANKEQTGLQRLNEWYPNQLFPLNSSLRIEAQKLLLKTNQISYFTATDTSDRFQTMGHNLLVANQFEKSKNRRKGFVYVSNYQNQNEASFYSILTQLENERWKKPWIAAGLSAIVPGAGRLYAGDWKNAIVSFLFVGMNTYQSYNGFRKNGIQSTSGWIFGSLAAGFYIGNIYGAAWTANRKNEQKKNKHRYALESIYYSYSH
jgi:hypothetical protein